MKVCSTCKISKEVLEFGLSKYSKDKLQPSCKICKREKEKAYYKKTQETQKARKRLTSKKYKENNINFTYKKKQYDSDRYQKNREKILKRTREYNKNNKWVDVVKTNNRRCFKLRATPKWADKKKISLIYKKAKWLESITGLKYHVDHVIPLKNKHVCGLHVWENLQIIEASLNMKKHNNFNPESDGRI